MKANTAASLFCLKARCTLTSVCLVVASINSPSLHAQGKDVDFVVPEIAQVQIVRTELGQTLTITATVKDDRALDFVTLHHRSGEAGGFTAEQMQQTTANRFETTVIPQNKAADLFQYYIEASDTSGNLTYNGYAFNPRTWQISTSSELNTTQRSNSDSDTTSTPGIETNPPFEYASVSASGNRTLYTVLGVLGAVVVAGVLANLDDDNGKGGDGSVTFIGPAPAR